jgi:hypothetical protein
MLFAPPISGTPHFLVLSAAQSRVNLRSCLGTTNMYSSILHLFTADFVLVERGNSGILPHFFSHPRSGTRVAT